MQCKDQLTCVGMQYTPAVNFVYGYILEVFVTGVTKLMLTYTEMGARNGRERLCWPPAVTLT